MTYVPVPSKKEESVVESTHFRNYTKREIAMKTTVFKIDFEKSYQFLNPQLSNRFPNFPTTKGLDYSKKKKLLQKISDINVVMDHLLEVWIGGTNYTAEDVYALFESVGVKPPLTLRQIKDKESVVKKNVLTTTTTVDEKYRTLDFKSDVKEVYEVKKDPSYLNYEDILKRGTILNFKDLVERTQDINKLSLVLKRILQDINDYNKLRKLFNLSYDDTKKLAWICELDPLVIKDTETGFDDKNKERWFNHNVVATSICAYMNFVNGDVNKVMDRFFNPDAPTKQYEKKFFIFGIVAKGKSGKNGYRVQPDEVILKNILERFKKENPDIKISFPMPKEYANVFPLLSKKERGLEEPKKTSLDLKEKQSLSETLTDKEISEDCEGIIEISNNKEDHSNDSQAFSGFKNMHLDFDVTDIDEVCKNLKKVVAMFGYGSKCKISFDVFNE